jgi:hypothetical protein
LILKPNSHITKVLKEKKLNMASTGDPEYKSSSTPVPASSAGADYFKFDLILRFLLFASSLVSVVVMVTGNQTEYLPLPLPAKFRYSPAFV